MIRILLTFVFFGIGGLGVLLSGMSWYAMSTTPPEIALAVAKIVLGIAMLYAMAIIIYYVTLTREDLNQ
jgi:hypothetical protein|tara:strand:+ start:662 stop:868 length:207 start_codon:yes stop_codon:yes gene_type:complete